MGGLAAALALDRQGIAVRVFEQASELRELGAGLTLSGGALRALDALGVLDAVKRVSQVSARMPFVHYQTARLLGGEFETPPTDAPEPPFVSRHIFRADLQSVLAEALHARCPGALQLGHSVTALTQDAGSVAATFANGQAAEGDFLIGADGLNSAVRAILWGAAKPTFTGQVAWRFLIDGALAKPFLSTGPGTVFFGPDRVFNRYLLRGGRLLNCVAIVRTPGWEGEGWSTPGDPDELVAMFTDWHPDVRGVMALAGTGRLAKWALGVRPPLPTWHAGRVALLGDAAHPMLPFLGLGAAMAIEDAVVLGRAFAAAPAPLAAFERYEAARLPRTREVALASQRQGEALQSRDPDDYRGAEAPVAQRSLFDHDPTTVPV